MEYQKCHELVIEIKIMAERPEIESSRQCRIFRVPHMVRKWNEDAYTPQVISIGPFHHKNVRLEAMEEHKERYFRSFLKRSKINLVLLVEKLWEMEERIRGCYDEPIYLDRERFLKMILLDVSFILELFIRHSLGSWSDDDSFLVQPRASAVMLDLLLLENQLPFFVIEELYCVAFPSLLSSPDGKTLPELSFYYFEDFNIRSIPFANVKIEHFTDLLRTFQLPQLMTEPMGHPRRIKRLYSATQLHEAGVKFEIGTSECYFDITFENGVLKIPRITINDMTEVIARNIMALEQTRYVERAYCTDYFMLLGLLIETGNDVDLLFGKGIFDGLDDSYTVKSMINNLNKGILWVSVRGDYARLCEKLNCFYERRPRHRWMAVIKREFFSTPSAAASTIFTVVVITVLTLIQTVCSILEVMGSS